MAQPSPGALVSSGDELCREYLAWRGCSAALREFDAERSADRGAGLSADRLTELIFATHCAGHDAAALCGLLDFLQARFFSRLDDAWAADTRKLESSVLRLFVVRALQAGRKDKVLELFDREASRLLALADDWQAWFTLPYVKAPASDARFAVYFSRAWADALATSYRNFLASVFAALPLPALARAGADRERVRALEAQLDALRAQCARLQADLDAARGASAAPSASAAEPAEAAAAPEAPRATREAEGALIGGLLRAGGAARAASPPPSSRGLPSAMSPTRRGAGGAGLGLRRGAFPSDAAPALRLASCTAFAGHASPVTCARFSPDGGCVASASADGTVRLWEHAHSGDGARSATLYCGGAVAALEWEPRSSKLLLLATAGGGLRAWNADSKRLVCDAPGAPGAPRVRALRTSPGDASFAVAAGNGLAIWSLRAFAQQSALPLPDDVHAAALAYNHNGRLLAAGCGDGTVRLFDVGAGAQIMTWRAHAAHAPPCSLQFGPDQTSVFSLGADGALVEWALHGDRSAVRRIDVSAFCGPAAGGLADDAADDEAAVAMAAQGCGAGAGSAGDAAALQQQQQRHELALQPSGRWALLTGAGCAAAAVDLRAGGAVRALHGHAAAVTCVDWHPSAPALCITGSADATVRTAELACDGGPQPPGDDDA